MAEKMKIFVKLTEGLDDLDKAAWMEMIDRLEIEVQKNISEDIDEGGKEGSKIWEEIFPFVQIIRFGLASNKISRLERSRIIGAILTEISGLMSPVEFAGLCYTTAFNSLHNTTRHGSSIPMFIVPSRSMRPEEKQDESGIVI